MAPRETENNAYAKFWGDKQRTLWYVMVFLEWSICLFPPCSKKKTNRYYMDAKDSTRVGVWLMGIQCNPWPV